MPSNCESLLPAENSLCRAVALVLQRVPNHWHSARPSRLRSKLFSSMVCRLSFAHAHGQPLKPGHEPGYIPQAKSLTSTSVHTSRLIVDVISHPPCRCHNYRRELNIENRSNPMCLCYHTCIATSSTHVKREMRANTGNHMYCQFKLHMTSTSTFASRREPRARPLTSRSLPAGNRSASPRVQPTHPPSCKIRSEGG